MAQLLTYHQDVSIPENPVRTDSMLNICKTSVMRSSFCTQEMSSLAQFNKYRWTPKYLFGIHWTAEGWVYSDTARNKSHTPGNISGGAFSQSGVQ
jgi:hypothetical protein